MNNDLISRKALKEEIETLCRNINAKYAITIPTSAFTLIVDNAPTVPLPDFKEGYKQAIRDGKTNFSRPTGEWIATQVIGISEITLTCSNCKDEFIGENDIDTWKSVYHYCPSCGAYMGEDMRKGEEEND